MVFEMNKMWKLAKKPVIVCMGIDTSLSMATNNDMQDVKDAALVRCRCLFYECFACRSV